MSIVPPAGPCLYHKDWNDSVCKLRLAGGLSDALDLLESVSV